MKIRYFKQARFLHKWMGLACFIFIFILSLSGILLMHSDSLELEKKMIDGNLLPAKYFHVEGAPQTVQALAVIPGTTPPVLFAGTDHGLFRSMDMGKTWDEPKQGLFSTDIRALAVDPVNTGTLYAGTLNGIFKSEDHGETWSEWFDAASGLTNTAINDLLIGSPDTLYAATQGGLFVSHDAGEFWESVGKEISENRDVRTIRFSAAHPGQLIAGTDQGAFRSADDGNRWKRKWENLPENISSLVALNTDPEFIFIGTGSGLYKSFNGGLNWLKDEHPHLKSIYTLTVDSAEQPGIYIASEEGLFYSLNGGDNWQDITPGKNNLQNRDDLSGTAIHTLLSVNGPETHLLLAGSASGLFISSDNGKQWRHTDPGVAENSVSRENFKMDMAKLITEIHTGRFFGDYFYWLIDLSSLGLIGLAISGLMVVIYREKIKKGKAFRETAKDEEIKVDRIIDISESVDDLSMDSQNIHDMVEHINLHLKKCKSVYNISRKKEEIDKIDKHIASLDQKLHHLMGNINGFAKLTQEIGDPETLVLPEKNESKNKEV